MEGLKILATIWGAWGQLLKSEAPAKLLPVSWNSQALSNVLKHQFLNHAKKSFLGLAVGFFGFFCLVVGGFFSVCFGVFCDLTSGCLRAHTPFTRSRSLPGAAEQPDAQYTENHRVKKLLPTWFTGPAVAAALPQRQQEKKVLFHFIPQPVIHWKGKISRGFQLISPACC